MAVYKFTITAESPLDKSDEELDGMAEQLVELFESWRAEAVVVYGGEKEEGDGIGDNEKRREE